MVVSLRMSKQEKELIKKVAKLYRISFSKLIRKALMGIIEEEMALKAYNSTKSEYNKNPVLYSFDEVNDILGISDV